MFLVLTYTANLFDKMILAGAGSITAAGVMQRVGGVEVLWSEWLLAFLPCSIVPCSSAWWLTLRLYPPERRCALEGGRDYLRQSSPGWDLVGGGDQGGAAAPAAPCCG